MKLIVLLLVLVASTAVLGADFPFWKIRCAGQPLFRGRADPIIAPGTVANHVHRVAGASNFNVETSTTDPVTMFNHLRSSSCTTCIVQNIDLSAYWHPDLFYKWPNGTLSLIPSGGLTVYYQGRAGYTGSQATPTYVPFPAGFRMIAGNPFRRSFNSSSVKDLSISFACIPASGNLPETNGFPSSTTQCTNGLRMQVRFPSCWNGKDLDSADHASHIVYPNGLGTDGNGDCPAGFPYRTMSLFFEAFYSVSAFPTQTYQPFVLACADNTGYGFHGDFLNGWDPVQFQKALNDTSCYAASTGGDNVKACKVFAPYVVEPSSGACPLAKPIPLTESFGKFYPMPSLPGCQNITGPQPQLASICYTSPQQSYNPPTSQRFALISKSTGKYVTTPVNNLLPIVATSVSANPSLMEAFVQKPWAAGSLQGFTLYPESCDGVCACSTTGNQNAVICNRPSADTSASSWEAFRWLAQGSYSAIIGNINGKYLTVQSDGTIAPTATTITDASLFSVVSLDGGHV